MTLVAHGEVEDYSRCQRSKLIGRAQVERARGDREQHTGVVSRGFLAAVGGARCNNAEKVESQYCIEGMFDSGVTKINADRRSVTKSTEGQPDLPWILSTAQHCCRRRWWISAANSVRCGACRLRVGVSNVFTPWSRKQLVYMPLSKPNKKNMIRIKSDYRPRKIWHDVCWPMHFMVRKRITLIVAWHRPRHVHESPQLRVRPSMSRKPLSSVAALIVLSFTAPVMATPTITGSLDYPNGVDIFAINITNFADFSAISGGAPFGVPDTELFLFSASCWACTRMMMTVAATHLPACPQQTPAIPVRRPARRSRRSTDGLYYLAITRSANSR